MSARRPRTPRKRRKRRKTPPRRKAAYVKAAGKSPARKLSPWVLDALDKAAGYADA